jgi:hypothetical protein
MKVGEVARTKRPEATGRDGQHPAMTGHPSAREATLGMTGHEVEQTSRDGVHKVTKSP